MRFVGFSEPRASFFSVVCSAMIGPDEPLRQDDGLCDQVFPFVDLTLVPVAPERARERGGSTPPHLTLRDGSNGGRPALRA